MDETEAVEMMQTNFVGQRHETETGTEYKITSARVECGVAELCRVPIDHHGELVQMNKEWIALDEYNDRALSPEGEWEVVDA